jgi:NAD(P)-dependent dehydrogenase (short-subunit alcohol dehydrogenase family)
MASLAGKAAIVTGAATLMGQKIVEAFVAAGVSVVMADINEQDGQASAAKLGDKALFRLTDVTRDGDIDGCLAVCEKNFGGVDFLVNLACTYLDNGIASTRAEWHQALDVNLVSSAIFIQKALPYMRRQNGGAVVNIASISGKRAQPGRMLYATSKAGVLHLTRTAAMQVVQDNIRVNSVSPGWTWSNIMMSLSGNDRQKTDSVAAPFHILGRAGDPEEVAKAVLFLCSDDSSFITGTDLAVDGGYTAIGPEQMIDSVGKLAE